MTPGRSQRNQEPSRPFDAEVNVSQCIYEIRYEYHWHSTAVDHWESAFVRVLSGPDAQEAVNKAREAALKLHQMNDNGIEERCTGFRLREVRLVAEATL